MLLPSLATLSVHCIAYNTWDFKVLRQYEQSWPIEQLQELLMLWSFRVLRLNHTFMNQLEHCEAWRMHKKIMWLNQGRELLNQGRELLWRRFI